MRRCGECSKNALNPWLTRRRCIPPKASGEFAWRMEDVLIAGIELSILARQCLDRRIPDRETLEREVAAWQDDRNAAGGPVHWRFTTADARIKLKHLYPAL